MIYHIRGIYTTHAVRLDKYKLTWFLKSHHVYAYTLFLPLNFLQTSRPGIKTMIYHIRGIYTTHAVRLDKYKLTWFLKSHHVYAYTLFLPLNFLQTNQYTCLFRQFQELWNLPGHLVGLPSYMWKLIMLLYYWMSLYYNVQLCYLNIQLSQFNPIKLYCPLLLNFSKN